VNLRDYLKICRQQDLPAGLHPLLRALWFDSRGDWDSAHALAQQDETLHGCRVHAYLHRKEGDYSNASYWYSRARIPVPACSLEEEWEDIARELLPRISGTVHPHYRSDQ
jgi:hypothetical protein